ncbi:MAG: mechanosensitive ion channel [Fusobacteriaceae bacterium]|jgi:small conductance mechanosensitive channel|nr:mechanosensitive ion channel [Fusobacteriaceae bacterium]MBP6467384.1 mechanosensitive ion channel [Fusobacteriaceae bacterium]MBP9596715.1 mechanosensitive ion channel [Fusobacteriaceae bacterium]MBU9917928.1 mechanosensitive ion channel [Fusobacteriaceae bacterium]
MDGFFKALTWELLLPMIIKYGIKLLIVIAVLFIGLSFIRQFLKLANVVMNKNRVDVTLIPFTLSVIGISLRTLLFITLISMLGIKITSFVALLGAAGLAIGLAFQGSLSNFASGVLILIFRPFNVGDYIDSQGNKGFVEEIQLLYTVIDTEENKKIVMPNSAVYSNIIAVDVNKTK